jgi:hypothetical protein
MAQIFHPSMNHVAKATVFGAVFFIGIAGYAATMLDHSPYTTDAGIVRNQPVPFSHLHHVGGLGLDCRYCHTSVEDSHFAGFPPTKTCMTCHSKIWTNAPMLQPVRSSFIEDRPIAWQRVHNLADFVYFNHSTHIAKGVGCATCHGQVDRMPLMYQANSLQMEWCLNCHRDPSQFLRPKDKVFDMEYTVPTGGNPVNYDGKDYTSQDDLGEQLLNDYHVKVGQLTNCYICHR